MDRERLLQGLTGADLGALPFSFRLAGRPSAEVLPGWRHRAERRPLDRGRTEHTLTFTDPETGLEVRCVALEYGDFPHLEWTAHFANHGATDSPVLSEILPLDATLRRGPEDGEFVLHHHVGSPCQRNDYQPLATRLGPGAEKVVTAAGGRPTNSDLPYFNLAWGGGGAIVVVGWPGQWAARFTRDAGAGLTVRAGQELTRFRLHAGETARTPLMVVQYWEGDRTDAQNTWRRWMVAHNLP
ncbi:MAG: hypothetical protein ABIL09_00185, partial [Gemmatimonadota bacterium]